jgi:hypothetical protein
MITSPRPYARYTGLIGSTGRAEVRAIFGLPSLFGLPTSDFRLFSFSNSLRPLEIHSLKLIVKSEKFENGNGNYDARRTTQGRKGFGFPWVVSREP